LDSSDSAEESRGPRAEESRGPRAPDPYVELVGGNDTLRETAQNRGSALFAITGAGLVSPLTLVLVRHGVTDMTITHELSGSSTPGPPLNAQGRIQAAKAADLVYRIGRGTWDRVPPVGRILASPMTRTQDTAAAIGRRLGVGVEVEDRLKEINFGQWEGLTGDEIAERFGDAIHRWRFGQYAAPGGESFPDVGARLDSLLVDLAAEHAALCAAGQDVPRAYALASHAVAIKSAIGVSMKMDASVWGSIWPAPASVTILELRVTTSGAIAERHLLCLGQPVE
jgi:broad specificity phosphatase PhoE